MGKFMLTRKADSAVVKWKKTGGEASELSRLMKTRTSRPYYSKQKENKSG